MGIRDLFENLKRTIANRSQPRADIDDNVTTDNFLRSLRRQRRIQMEEIEKEQLKKKIALFEKAKTSRNLFGISNRIQKVRAAKKIRKATKVSILKKGNFGKMF